LKHKSSNQNADIEHIMDQYGGMVMTICKQIVMDDRLAEEATQDTFMKAYKNLNRFRADCSLKTWIYRIAYHTAIDYSRKKKMKIISYEDLPPESALQGTLNPYQTMEDSEQKMWIQSGVGQLPVEQAAIIRLYYMEEKNVKEVSDITGLSESNVKIKLFRARRSLAEILVKSQNAYLC
jgi:RNA polymerase sigma-70 factor (ECF subfamily)